MYASVRANIGKGGRYRRRLGCRPPGLLFETRHIMVKNPAPACADALNNAQQQQHRPTLHQRAPFNCAPVVLQQIFRWRRHLQVEALALQGRHHPLSGSDPQAWPGQRVIKTSSGRPRYSSVPLAHGGKVLSSFNKEIGLSAFCDFIDCTQHGN